ncbi:hypothetical protein KOAAANKH_00597 [Brevundimonas sp. NIBR10]|nr:hypothetical protein KOAAANKH_00597 [Brevundimonas sp. NIBR10]
MLIWLALLALSDAAGPIARPDLSAAVARYGKTGSQEELEILIASGVPGAQAFLDGLTAIKARDFPAACRAWGTAADVSAEAAHFTAECYQNGYEGAPKDMARAVALYTAAGEGGYAKSLCALGNLYAFGEGVPADPARGFALCRRGAEAGDPDAQTDLGNFYGRGEGVQRDYGQARFWYEQAASQNQRNAAFQRATMAWNGLGGPVDRVEAGIWFEKAYSVGRKDAALLIGRSALTRAVPNAPVGPVDLVLLAEARRWILIATTEDPEPEGRAAAAVLAAQISGYEALARQDSRVPST